MEYLESIFTTGKELSVLQMTIKGFIVFFIGLIVIRLSGRRSFGMGTPFDNIITILLGAILGETVSGTTPFLPAIITATSIALLHRFCAWFSLRNKIFGNLIKGTEKILYKDGKISEKNMKRTLLTKEDLMEGIRLSINSDSITKVKMVYMERNGEISVVTKEERKLKKSKANKTMQEEVKKEPQTI